MKKEDEGYRDEKEAKGYRDEKEANRVGLRSPEAQNPLPTVLFKSANGACVAMAQMATMARAIPAPSHLRNGVAVAWRKVVWRSAMRHGARNSAPFTTMILSSCSCLESLKLACRSNSIN